MTRPATARRQEDALLADPWRAAFLTAGVLAVTAVVFALAADHGTLARIQRLDDAWLRLIISGRTPFPSGHAIAASVTVVAAVIALIPAGRRRSWWGLVTALAADQFQRRRNRLQRPAGTQSLAGVTPANHAEDSR
jgi:hypothetical protein